MAGESVELTVYQDRHVLSPALRDGRGFYAVDESERVGEMRDHFVGTFQVPAARRSELKGYLGRSRGRNVEEVIRGIRRILEGK